MKIKMIMIGLWLAMGILHAVNVGDNLPSLTLDKANGGDSNDRAWHSESLKGKVHVLLYMDPDKREEAMPFLDALNKKKYDKQHYSTIAIVNLAATWMPDAILETLLSKKQKELHNTIFIFDKTKYLVKKWHLEDDASNVLICDKSGKILYKNSTHLSSKEIDKIMDIIAQHI